ncbi:hypothetical protein L1987_26394 [Smallanthus sonchifolius]|uniref:Uncharacterized protein n=1 Tax=Smallanthus sonchifolius TaxID=185202 RepID=A0ACB9IC68_9ASTR|nr:hypothetical protein L1987_26394 [Smallanthus sonchifolius]
MEEQEEQNQICVQVAISCYSVICCGQSGTVTEEYLTMFVEALQVAVNSFDPELVNYIVGTDLLDGDPLGRLRVSPHGVTIRDEKDNVEIFNPFADEGNGEGTGWAFKPLTEERMSDETQNFFERVDKERDGKRLLMRQ